MDQLPQIIDYEHYSDFLKARYSYFKSKKRGFSYGTCAKKINSTASYLKDVIAGRKRIGLTRISKIAALFEMDEFETEYFSVQVIRDLIKDEKINRYFKQILGSMAFTVTHREILKESKFSTDSGAHLSNWLYDALIELMNFPNYEDSDSWIRGKLIDGPNLSPERIRGAIQELLDLDAIVKKGNRYVWKKPGIAVASAFDKAQFKFHRGVIEKTWEAIGAPDKYWPSGHFHGIMAVSDESMKLLQQASEEYRDKVIKIVAETKSPTRVVAFINSFFQLTR